MKEMKMEAGHFPAELAGQPSLAAAYFENTVPLVGCGPCQTLTLLSDRLLELVMDICQSPLDRTVCRAFLRQTQAMQTVMDARLFHADPSVFSPSPVCVWMGEKARHILEQDVQMATFFDPEVLTQTVRMGAEQGKCRDMRLYACLSWLGGHPDRAIRLWHLLALGGELFAMDALAYAQRTAEQPVRGIAWEQIRKQYFQATQQQRLTPEKSDDSKAVADMVQLILAVRDLCRQNGEKTLPLHILQYAADAEDTIEEKLRNLQASSTEHITMLRRQLDGSERTYGF